MDLLRGFCIFCAVFEILGVAGFLIRIIVNYTEAQRLCESQTEISAKDCSDAIRVVVTIMCVVCVTKLLASVSLLFGLITKKIWAILIWIIYNGIVMGLILVTLLIRTFNGVQPQPGGYFIGIGLFMIVWVAVTRYRLQLVKEQNTTPSAPTARF